VTKDDVICISGAAGVTGSAAARIAKHVLDCMHVISIAGGEKKCGWVRLIGTDTCVDYKAADFREQLLKATEGYVSVCFDNVAGEILDLMLTRIANYGRVIACGAIITYNASGKDVDVKTSQKNWFQVVVKRLENRGFIAFDLGERMGEYIEKLVQAVKEGNLMLTDNNTVVNTKWEDLPKTWNLLFTGGNQGKLVTKIVD
jgi:NADPH-dependent curcumin reductase CurA